MLANPPDNLPQFGNVAELMRPLFESANSYTSALTGIGLKLLALAVAIELMNMVLQFWVKGGANDLVAKFVRLLVVTSIPFAALKSWPDLPVSLIHFFQVDVASVFTKNHGGDSLGQVSSAINDLFHGVVSVFQVPPAAEGSGVVDRAAAAIMTFAIYVILFFPVLLAVLAMLFALYGPMLMVYVGLIFGPILICWLPFEPLNNLATKWLSYMITMGLSFAVGIAMAGIMAGALHTFAQTLHDTSSDSGLAVAFASLAGLLPMLAVICFVGYMMLKVEHIAAGLVGGPSIGGGAGFFGFMGGKAMGAVKGGSGKKDSSPGKDGAANKAGADGAAGGAAGASPSGTSQQASLSAQAGQAGASAPATAASPSTASAVGGSAPSGGAAGAAAGAAGAAAGKGGAMAALRQNLANGAKGVAGSGAFKAAAFVGAATVGGAPAALAAGVLAVSPKARAAVGKVAKGGAALGQRTAGVKPKAPTSAPSTTSGKSSP